MVHRVVRGGVKLYGVIAEDGSIEKAIPFLIPRIVTGEDVEVECRRLNGKNDFIANFWRTAKEFQFKYPAMHKVLAICDADRESPDELEEFLTDKARDRLPGLPLPLVFHVIKKELETWWIADANTISVLAGVQVNFPGGNVEDSVQDAKEYLEQPLRQVKTPYTPTLAGLIAQHVNLDVVGSRCPGFVVFMRRVENGNAAPPERPYRRISLAR